MSEPPFDVVIHILPTERGVYQTRPIAQGIVDGPDGPIEVSLGIQQAVSRTGEIDEGPMTFGLTVGTKGLTIDVTDFLERIAKEYFRRDDPPPNTLEFKKRRP